MYVYIYIYVCVCVCFSRWRVHQSSYGLSAQMCLPCPPPTPAVITQASEPGAARDPTIIPHRPRGKLCSATSTPAAESNTTHFNTGDKNNMPRHTTPHHTIPQGCNGYGVNSPVSVTGWLLITVMTQIMDAMGSTQLWRNRKRVGVFVWV